VSPGRNLLKPTLQVNIGQYCSHPLRQVFSSQSQVYPYSTTFGSQSEELNCFWSLRLFSSAVLLQLSSFEPVSTPWSNQTQCSAAELVEWVSSSVRGSFGAMQDRHWNRTAVLPSHCSPPNLCDTGFSSQHPSDILQSVVVSWPHQKFGES